MVKGLRRLQASIQLADQANNAAIGKKLRLKVFSGNPVLATTDISAARGVEKRR